MPFDVDPPIRLTPISDRDVKFLEELVSCPAVRAYLGGPVPDPALHVRESYFSDTQERSWVARCVAGGVPKGVVTLGVHRDTGEAEVSYQFRKTQWGKGFARVAVGIIVDWALRYGGHPCIVAETQRANTRSCFMLRRLGFRDRERLIRFGAEQVLFARSKTDAYAVHYGIEENENFWCFNQL